MKVAYNSEKLGDIFRDFFRVSGINVNLVDTDFSFLDCNPTIHNHYCQCIQDTKPGQKECFLSDLRLLKECRNLKNRFTISATEDFWTLQFPLSTKMKSWVT